VINGWMIMRSPQSGEPISRASSFVRDGNHADHRSEIDEAHCVRKTPEEGRAAQEVARPREGTEENEPGSELWPPARLR
jgi:hypothetical protein